MTAENDLAVLKGVGLDTDDRQQVLQVWRVTLATAGTVKLQARHSGGTAGDFTVNAANTTLTAYVAGGSTADVVQVASGAGNVRIPGLAAHAAKAGLGGGGITEEYDTTTTGLTWSPTTPATVDSNTTVPSHLYLEWGATGNTETLGLRAWAPAGAFDARMHVAAQKASDGNTVACGLIITSSGDTSRALVQLAFTTTTCTVQSFTYASGTYTQRGSTWTSLGQGKDYYLRITRDGSNNVAFYWSGNGRIWTQIATLSFTFTVASIGLRVSHNGTSTVLAMSDFLRTDV